MSNQSMDIIEKGMQVKHLDKHRRRETYEEPHLLLCCSATGEFQITAKKFVIILITNAKCST